MLEHQGMTAGEAMRRSAPAPKTPPMGEPDGDEPAGGMSVTITDNGDGTFSCDDGSGQPSQHASFDEAADYAKQTMGVADDMPMDDAEPEVHPAKSAPTSDSTDLAGMYAKK